MQTRWYLQRHDIHPKLVRLVVEEVCAAAPRGCTISVTCRRHARDMLPILREALHQRILRADAPAGARYDPVDA